LVSKISLILDLLSDGKWHDLVELSRKSNLDSREIDEILSFLDKYEFARVDFENGKAKINKVFQKLLELTTP
jgi:hypothetical protein